MKVGYQLLIYNDLYYRANIKIAKTLLVSIQNLDHYYCDQLVHVWIYTYVCSRKFVLEKIFYLMRL